MLLDIRDFSFKNMYENKPKQSRSKNVKHLIKELKTKKYDLDTHYALLRYDADATYFDFENKINFFPPSETTKLRTHLFFGNFIEKYIVYTDESNKEQIIKEDLPRYHDMIFNSKGVETKKNIFADIFFKLSHEQMIHQERHYEQYVYRMYYLFKDCEVSKNKFLNIVGIDFNKYIALIWYLFALFFKQKKVISAITRQSFKDYLLKGDIKNINESEIDTFFDFIAITRKEFIDKYMNFRKDKDDKLLSYDKLAHIDQYLPKPSYYYPFLKVNDDTIRLISYTALLQYIHLESIFALIADSDTEYRSKTLGALLEKYICRLFNDFKNNQKDNTLKIHYYENQQYFPKKGTTRHYPDVIIESKDYIIFIESKSSAVNLKNAIQNFGEKAFSNTIEAIEKSKININEFLKYNPLNIEDLDKKKTYKFVCFNVVSSSMLSALRTADFINYEDLIITDLSSIELFTHLKNPIDTIKALDSFIKDIDNPSKTSSLEHYCDSKLNVDIDFFQNKHLNILSKFIHMS